MKRLISLLLILCTLSTLLLSSCLDSFGFGSFDNTDPESAESSSETVSEQQTNDEKEEQPPMEIKSIDIYIIAGQSNGSGYTRYNSSKLAELWPEYMRGAKNVLYSGRAEYTNNVNTSSVSTGVNEYKKWVPAKAGMGMSVSHIGAEVGMASYLSKNYYNEANGNKIAGIIKYAHGGTSLLNNKGGENAAGGNWVSPSYAKALGVSYSGLTGGLYRGLLEQIKRSIALLEDDGYNDINIKGVFWMQGESDVDNPNEYEKAFKLFVSDLRADIGKIMEEDCSSLAIMVGEISRTSGSASASRVSTNERFITMQRKLSEKINDVYVIASGKFEINWLDASGNNKNGQDAWHWTTEDMFAIGELVGKCIVNDILK